ncbi:MAG: UMP kinase [Candidatus Taylorbacteria bacterium]|nr:UMP kinase [Candidatus Taylorbacteria bacterium]
MQSPTIISLGGSIVVPDGIDIAFISAFRTLIQERMKLGESFIVIVGGGKVCRRYQASATELGVTDKDQLDWVGIFATRLNAELVRVAFGDIAHSELVLDPAVLSKVTAPLVIGAGWKPGHSTDFGAILMAESSGAKRIINLSNIDYVYDKDPRKFPDAKKIECATWKEFRDLLPEPSAWVPGLNAPFDPVAAKRGSELSLEIAIMNGNNLEHLKNYFEGKPFTGTVIR